MPRRGVQVQMRHRIFASRCGHGGRMENRTITRRTFGSFIAAGALAPLAPALAAAPLSDALSASEKETGGRLGVAVEDMQGGARFAHRAGERFPMCSTFKWLAAAAVLKRVDDGRERLDRRMRFSKADLIANSPASRRHVASGMTLEEACDAAVTLSDNTAANLLLSALGGPQGVTSFARSLGDAVTRLDRTEPAMNDVRPGDPRDTTTPAAMLATMKAVLLGDVLKPASRETLVDWLVANKTGDTRIRAGLPKDWRVGDKTGTGRTSNNDLAIAWPPQRKPLLIVVYIRDAKAPFAATSASIAKVAREVVRVVG